MHKWNRRLVIWLVGLVILLCFIAYMLGVISGAQIVEKRFRNVRSGEVEYRRPFDFQLDYER